MSPTDKWTYNAITKEEFDKVYNRYKPGAFLRFAYTHYNVKMKRTPKPIGTWAGVIGWIIGTIGLIVFDQLGMKDIAMKFLWAYVPFAAFIISLPAFLLNQSRTKKIARKLGVSLDEYNKLVDKFYPS